jgi:hypothetical protein
MAKEAGSRSRTFANWFALVRPSRADVDPSALCLTKAAQSHSLRVVFPQFAVERFCSTAISPRFIPGQPIALGQQVRRNPKRFPSDFLFELDEEEVEALLSQM